MKRYFLLLAAAALAAVSCQEKEQDGFTPAPGTEYTLEGTVKAEGFAWAADSQLGLFSATSGVRVLNAKCPIASGAGEANATFKTPGLDLVEGENRFAVCFPYNAAVIYASGRFNNFNVSDAQTQAAPGAAASCYAVGMAAGTPGTDETFKFELNPVTAIAKVTVGTSIEKYVGQSIKKVTIYNDDNIIIGGSFNVTDINTGAIQVLENKGATSVAVAVSAPEAIVAGKTQDLYVNLLPADFSGKKVNVLIDVEKDGKSSSILLAKSDFSVKAGEVVEFDFSDIKESDIATEKWYCSDDNRYFAGLGYAYGQANTFFTQCKNGSTYKGTAYSADSNIPDEVVIDYRVRGNLANITEDLIPDNVTFEWMTLSNGKVYGPYHLTDKGNVTCAPISENSFTFTQDAANYTVTVKNNSAVAGSPILLMKKNGKILWAWAFWTIAADGAAKTNAETILEPVKVANYKFAPMDLGQPTTSDKWSANTMEYMFRMNLLYQWGRPFPIMWTNFWFVDGVGAEGRVPSAFGPMTLKESLSTVGMIVNQPANQGMKDWCSEKYTDLWGTDTPEKDGEKSIYDPCPEGWRVATLPAINALISSGAPTFHSKGNNAHSNMTSLEIGGMIFYNNGFCNAKLKPNADLSIPNENQPSTIMQFGVSNSTNSTLGYLWSNAAGDEQGQVMYWADPDKNDDGLKASSNDRSHVMSVRCIVDEKNR